MEMNYCQEQEWGFKYFLKTINKSTGLVEFLKESADFTLLFWDT
jgi:hypothetical protein